MQPGPAWLGGCAARARRKALPGMQVPLPPRCLPCPALQANQFVDNARKSSHRPESPEQVPTTHGLPLGGLAAASHLGGGGT